MATITIPKELTANINLIAIPSAIYREFLSWQKKIKAQKTFQPSVAELKSLAKARKNFAKGNFITLGQMQNELANNY